MGTHQPDLFLDFSKPSYHETGCGFACSLCGTRTDENNYCGNCKVEHDELGEIIQADGYDLPVGFQVENIEAIVDTLVKDEGFEVKLGNNTFSNIKVKTEKGFARISFSCLGFKGSVLINPNLNKKIISKTGGFISNDIYMSIVKFINHLCEEKEKFNLTRYKAFQ